MLSLASSTPIAAGLPGQLGERATRSDVAAAPWWRPRWAGDPVLVAAGGDGLEDRRNCPDATLYIRMAAALDRGDLGGGLEKICFNPFPAILVLLHRAGLEWETAGVWWGVVISSCTALPLWGWIRRQFDRRVALAARFLYAVHPGLIRWSPEVLRDPTFWFLFSLSLYLVWRAVTELRWPLVSGPPRRRPWPR